MPVEILENPEPPRISVSTEEGAAVEAGLPRTELGPSPGDRLERGLQMDRKLREARTRVMQRRINRAHRVEQEARNVCVGAGLGSIFVWVALLAPVMPPGRYPVFLMEPLRVVTLLVTGVIGIALPLAAVAAVLARRWRQHLIEAAAEQHLEVRDPGRIDYR